MASVHAITSEPMSLADATEEVIYTIQNQSAHNVFVETSASAPTDQQTAFSLGQGEFARVKANSGERIYVWSKTEKTNGNIVYDEAP